VGSLESTFIVSELNGITFGIAILGAVLGVFNTWQSWRRDRVKLRVQLRWLIWPTDRRIGIEITNDCFLSVTISGIGFSFPDTDQEMAIIPEFTSGEQLPLRLEPRASATAILPLTAENEITRHKIKSVWVKTACDKRFSGPVPAGN
jgi:hypothetical protein